MSESCIAPLSDAIIVALAQLVDDAQTDRRDPSHWDIENLIKRHSLVRGDPNSNGQTVGKAKRVRAVLGWAIEESPEAGGAFVTSFVGLVRGHGGFRVGSANYIGADAIQTCVAAFDTEGFHLGSDGELRPKVLEALSGAALTDALRSYVRRAKRGVEDAALEIGTGKDLVEAVAAHILQEKFGAYPQQANFPTLLGQAFVAIGLATPEHAPQPANLPNEGSSVRCTSSLAELTNFAIRTGQDMDDHGFQLLPMPMRAQQSRQWGLLQNSCFFVCERLLGGIL